MLPYSYLVLQTNDAFGHVPSAFSPRAPKTKTTFVSGITMLPTEMTGST